MELWSLFLSYFWSPNFWFPPHLSWDSIKNTDDGVYHPQTEDLYYVLPIAAIITLLRKLFEFYIGAPLGKYMGLKEKSSKQNRHNPVLEEAFTHNKNPEHKDIVGLSKKTGLTVRQVEIWHRVKHNINKPTKLTKFTEGSWRFICYLVVFFSGLYILWDKPWFMDTKKCWEGYPHQNISNDLFTYYQIQMGFYVSLFISQFFDVKRKDFYEMLIHHSVTIVLLFVSWSINFVRIGTLVLILHDANDYLLELSKLLAYVKMTRILNPVFVLFAITWIVTRLIIFPFWIIHSNLFESIKTIGIYNLYYVNNGFLFLLLLLNVVWFYFIIKVALGAIFADGMKDSRSDTEESDNDK